MGSRRTQQVVVRMPVGMLKSVRGHAQRHGLPITAIILRVLERAGYGRYDPVRGRPRGGSSPQEGVRRAKKRSMIKARSKATDRKTPDHQSPRLNSTQERVLALLRRPGGATIAGIMQSTGGGSIPCSRTTPTTSRARSLFSTRLPMRSRVTPIG